MVQNSASRLVFLDLAYSYFTIWLYFENKGLDKSIQLALPTITTLLMHCWPVALNRSSHFIIGICLKLWKIKEVGWTPTSPLGLRSMPECVMPTLAIGWVGACQTKLYLHYIRKLYEQVKHWITLNEPKETSVSGYGTGGSAPGVKVQKACNESYFCASIDNNSH